jgi:hypothetical protein
MLCILRTTIQLKTYMQRLILGSFQIRAHRNSPEHNIWALVHTVCEYVMRKEKYNSFQTSYEIIR